MGELYVALIHAPGYNKHMEQIATSITNLDIHDIARSSATYGVKAYYIVHPGPAQQDLARRIMSFWREGYGAEYNPNRYEAFANVRLKSALEDVLEEIGFEEQGKKSLILWRPTPGFILIPSVMPTCAVAWRTPQTSFCSFSARAGASLKRKWKKRTISCSQFLAAGSITTFPSVLRRRLFWTV
jgi:hypothetical protein